eukprot:Plantae.Rhodophyta-Rhodochaete_pulchella.ctg407.p2 GENE.Plantae.Rhodophyta-Rhodochaete_pulchella.ctg407~~Plantae.Rhodophyta-Rhodochaete_pulchella.ctg407.p2  ORF type:complete len:245 (-),score=20.90 Plantae.Rhodophyta-Rhodochaete_pulchella.ctg407:1316-1996(-)
MTRESELGTKEHWDRVYAEELQAFNECGDGGEDWFASHTGNGRLARFVQRLFTDRPGQDVRDQSVLDIGCGNGMFSSELAELGFGCVEGWDYSPPSIQLAGKNLEAGGSRCSSKVSFHVMDVFDGESHCGRKFDVVHDKGTFDAILLNPSSDLDRFVEVVHALCVKFWVITSCNNTRDELLQRFGSHFDFHSSLDHPVLKFGGREGTPVCTIAFTPRSHDKTYFTL